MRRIPVKPFYMIALFFVVLTASLPAFATTDGIYVLNKNLTASWDGTTANRLNSATSDYDYAYGDESAVTYTLPWSFTFYGQPYSQITADQMAMFGSELPDPPTPSTWSL